LHCCALRTIEVSDRRLAGVGSTAGRNCPDRITERRTRANGSQARKAHVIIRGGADVNTSGLGQDALGGSE
jgi:hypothetical protein